MKISSKIMALAVSALLMAGPALAADVDLGVKSSTTVKSKGSFSGTSGATMKASTHPGIVKSDTTVKTKSNMGLHRCGGNRGEGKGNMCDLGFTSLDANANGSVTRTEFRSKNRQVGLFNKIDANRDGIISQTELDKYNSR
jgi:hypothetical protein